MKPPADGQAPDGEGIVAEIPGDKERGDDEFEGDSDDGRGWEDDVDQKEKGQNRQGEGITDEDALEGTKDVLEDAGFWPGGHAYLGFGAADQAFEGWAGKGLGQGEGQEAR